jgi:hypothetical protein
VRSTSVQPEPVKSCIIASVLHTGQFLALRSLAMVCGSAGNANLQPRAYAEIIGQILPSHHISQLLVGRGVFLVHYFLRTALYSFLRPDFLAFREAGESFSRSCCGVLESCLGVLRICFWVFEDEGVSETNRLLKPLTASQNPLAAIQIPVMGSQNPAVASRKPLTGFSKGNTL